ncbi:MAG: hypothetical protein Q7N50_09945 [Armatimonadota bacterium]|nr:hypothetical protein [Armatimonadota bacterium]
MTAVSRLFAVLIVLAASPALARDMTGLSAQLTPEQGDWVRGLKDRNGVLCCDTADGYDVAWQSAPGGGYLVLIKGLWRLVPAAALIDDIPNKLGVARVWYTQHGGEVVIRCFIPGAGT